MPPAGTTDRGTAWKRDPTGGGVLPGGDVGGAAQLAESFSVRFHHTDQPSAIVTYCYYAAINLGDLTTIYVEQQTEYLVCTDPADLGGTEGLVPLHLHRPGRPATFGSVQAATAAKRAAESHLVCNEDWSGWPPWSED